MPEKLDALLEGLSQAERRPLTAAFAADRELARGLATMVDGLPRCVTELLMRRLSVHLRRLGLGEGVRGGVGRRHRAAARARGTRGLRCGDRHRVPGLLGSRPRLGVIESSVDALRSCRPGADVSGRGGRGDPGRCLRRRCARPPPTDSRAHAVRALRCLRHARGQWQGGDARVAYLNTVGEMGIER